MPALVGKSLEDFVKQVCSELSNEIKETHPSTSEILASCTVCCPWHNIKGNTNITTEDGEKYSFQNGGLQEQDSEKVKQELKEWLSIT